MSDVNNFNQGEQQNNEFNQQPTTGCSGGEEGNVYRFSCTGNLWFHCMVHPVDRISGYHSWYHLWCSRNEEGWQESCNRRYHLLSNHIGIHSHQFYCRCYDGNSDVEQSVLRFIRITYICEVRRERMVIGLPFVFFMIYLVKRIISRAKCNKSATILYSM